MSAGREHLAQLETELRGARLLAELERGEHSVNHITECDYSDSAELRPFDLVVRLTENQAYALAELCKRIGWSDCRTLSVSDDQCRSMIAATDRVRAGLAAIDVRVR